MNVHSFRVRSIGHEERLTANLLRAVQRDDNVARHRLTGIIRAPLIVKRHAKVFEAHRVGRITLPLSVRSAFTCRHVYTFDVARALCSDIVNRARRSSYIEP